MACKGWENNNDTIYTTKFFSGWVIDDRHSNEKIKIKHCPFCGSELDDTGCTN